MTLGNFRDLLIIGVIIGASIGIICGFLTATRPIMSSQSLYYKIEEGVENLERIENILKEIQSLKSREKPCDISSDCGTDK